MTEPSPPITATPPRGSAAARLSGWIRRLGPAGPLAVVVVALPAVGGAVLLGTLRELGPWCREHAWGAAPFVVALAGAFLAGGSLLPTYAITILAGWSFGFAVGLPVAFVAHAAAGLFGFGLARALVGHRVPHALSADPKLEAVRSAMVGRGFARATGIIALIRLAPVAPFGITNLLAASARCPFSAFAIGSALGILPQTALLVFAASRMSRLSFEQEPWMVVGGIASTVVVVAIITAIAKRALSRATAGSHGAGDSTSH
jgi:uncharacterized membrane protein YdjX (TVP38/TMEM64 family)